MGFNYFVPKKKIKAKNSAAFFVYLLLISFSEV